MRNSDKYEEKQIESEQGNGVTPVRKSGEQTYDNLMTM